MRDVIFTFGLFVFFLVYFSLIGLPSLDLIWCHDFTGTDVLLNNLIMSSGGGGGAVTMLQITEDTPPDMLAGAMDLTVHLPTGRAVKMAVERSTPMMDLLVQITTNHHLQLSNYTLQALGMAPSSEHSDKILPYKPNTPIGTLDTQHIRVVSKSRTLPVAKNIAPGHQPFESTFRLKVHLPRNQLYVTRVSRNVLLEDIMKKVCEEKNLDPVKYELKHPGNLDEVLDPKLTLSDYQITEIYVVLKGTLSLNQAFSTNDIMALRKEEERKQMHNKTGGGVFNLIFRRGKSSMGSGSISSDTRSISPTHSDDSRSVTPPAVPQQILTPPKKDPPQERPKPPQRKRRPAPKPPNPDEETRRISEDNRRNSEDKPPSSVSEVSELQTRKTENGLTICHSRNSSDSSGYHEASVLSDNCNTSLPRRPKSAFVGNGDVEKMLKMHSQSTTNLSKMSYHSKSTTSLGIAGRKKKAAPPPPPAIRASNPAINIETPSNVVASQPASTQQESHLKDENVVAPPNIVPLPRNKLKMASKEIPKPSPRHDKSGYLPTLNETIVSARIERTKIDNNTIVEEIINENIEEDLVDEPQPVEHKKLEKIEKRTTKVEPEESETIIMECIEDIPSDTSVDRNEQIEECRNEPKTTDDVVNSSVELPKEETKEDPPINKKDTTEEIKTTNRESYSNKVVTLAKEDNFNDTKKINLEIQQTSVATDTVEPKPVIISQIQKQTHLNIFSSPEFLDQKKPPEVIGVIPKTPEPKTSVDSLKTAPFQGRPSLTDHSDIDISTLRSRQSIDSYPESINRTSINSAVESLSYMEDWSDVEGASIRNRGLFRESMFSQLYGINNLEHEYRRTDSVTSLRSLQSLPGFFNTGGLKKWNNFEDLDDMSLAYVGPSSTSVIGDHFDETESFSSQQALDSLASITSCPSNIAEVKKENHFFGSTDSGIAQETAEKLSEIEDSRIITPPPPPLLDEPLPDTIVPPPPLEETIKDTLELVTGDTNTTQVKPEDTPSPETSTEVSTKEILTSTEEVTPLEEKVNEPSDERLKETSVTDNIKEDDIDWQYQLPSPPKAFRDHSPLPESVTSDSQSTADCKDSVVTSPELFEKLKSIEDNQSDKGTLVSSDLSSVVSEEEKPLFNNLSLENLEKRKSLVYNRELSTSLKMTDNLMQIQAASEETFSTSLSTFESTFVDLQQSSHKRETIEPKYVQKPITTHTLPNFKISTYDKPKQKIKVFEDDTIRSNTDNFTKVSKSTIETGAIATSKLNKSYFRRSMENISYRKNSFEDHLTPPKEETDQNSFRIEATPMPKNFGPMSSIFRSESFSTDTHWSPSRPVSRSKSYLALNANNNKEEIIEQTEKNMSRSNSLYDVSGLQSLGVMRLIQNKLNTPTSSMENVNLNQHSTERFQKAFTPPEPTRENPLPPKPPQPEEAPKPVEKVYKYRGPPSVNMGTWSDRPKIPVSVKEDADYKLGNNVSSKLIVNTTNNNITSNNTLEVKRTTNSIKVNGYDQKTSNSVSIKIKGTEPVHSQEKPIGNVIIKIGALNSEKPKMIDNQRFINHTTAAGYRKPFSTISNNQSQRPHSIAFGSDFDISRVPVVRSVELKKPYKEMNNTSVTHIYQGDNFRSEPISKPEPVSELKTKFTDLQRNNTTEYKYNFTQEKDPKPVMRVSSFKPFGAAPVVRGFKSNEPKVNINRFSWNTSNNFNTLPVNPREKDTYLTNTQVPFSQSTLRRTESSKLTPGGVQSEPDSPVASLTERSSFNSLPHVTKTEIKPPPPPPLMPKVNLKKPVYRPAEPTLDQRDQLLSAIRNFGGKKGLKSVKV